MYAHIIASTGWTWDYIDDHMTFPRLAELTRYWMHNPTIHQIGAAYFGIKPETPTQNIEEAGAYVPVATISASEFSDVLSQHGLIGI